jgi:hypothetical protein
VFVYTLFWMALQRHRRPGAARIEKAFKSTFRAAGPPALCCHAIMACCEGLRSRCKGRREVGARQRDVAWTSAVLWISRACHSGAMAKLHRTARAIAGRRAFNGLCDDEGMPLICPTSQVLMAQSVRPGNCLVLCMGLFSIFLVGSHRDAAWLRESRLKPHTLARRSRWRKVLQFRSRPRSE